MASSLSRIKLGFCRESLTGHGGLLLVGEFRERLGLSSLLDRHLPQPGSGRGFKPSQVVGSIVSLLFNNGEHLSDISHMSSDSLLPMLNGVGKFPASNTLTEWLGRCERWVEHDCGGGLENVVLQGLELVNRKLLGVLARHIKKTGLTLDIDATVIKTEKGTAKITYKGFPGYQPQLAYLPELRAFSASEFRSGDVPSSKDVVPYLERCKANMPEGTRIGTVRADAAYYQRDVLKWCIDNGSHFAIRAGRDLEVMRVISEIPESAWERHFDSDGIEQPDAQVASTSHSMEGVGWFRLVAVRRRWERGEQLDLIGGKYSYWPIATNLSGSAQDVIHFYNQRGRMEDGIGQLKQDFGLSAMPCSDMKANAVWTAIGILAFTIFAMFKSLVLGADWVVRKAKKVRFHIFDIPGRLVRHAGELRLNLCCSKTLFRLLCKARRRCQRLVFEFS